MNIITRSYIIKWKRNNPLHWRSACCVCSHERPWWCLYPLLRCSFKTVRIVSKILLYMPDWKRRGLSTKRIDLYLRIATINTPLINATSTACPRCSREHKSTTRYKFSSSFIFAAIVSPATTTTTTTKSPEATTLKQRINSSCNTQVADCSHESASFSINTALQASIVSYCIVIDI